MPQVQLTDDLYKEASQRASEAGYSSVDAYIAQIISEELRDEESIDRRFTPAVIADLEQISKEMEAGDRCSSDEVQQHLDQVRRSWRKKHVG